MDTDIAFKSEPDSAHASMERAANFTPLTPLSFLPKVAALYPHKLAIVHGEIRRSWAETYSRCKQLASALVARGVRRGDTVAIIATNTPQMYEAHFGVPMAGAVLNTLNTRLDASALAFQLTHGEAKVLFTDREFSLVVKQALELLTRRPLVIDIDDPLCDRGFSLGEMDYEEFLNLGDHEMLWELPSDELSPIALNYTSGTTGDPKGVITHHRGAYLNAISQVISWGMAAHPVYLWTLPMFHCNGWCFPWTIAANAGVNVFLRRVEPLTVFELIQQHSVTHLCGAPIVYNMLVDVVMASGRVLNPPVSGLVAGAAPSTTLLEGAERIGMDLTHVYGLTEVYGPAAVCVKQSEWAEMKQEHRAQLNARQGVASLMQQSMEVLDPDSLQPVPADGVTVGEIMFQGNITMSGYLKNPEATRAAFAGGWFHTGDMAVVEPDGYVRITDRSKDIIISGGENIFSLEIEEVLHRHPAVSLAAVVAKPDQYWGEVPCAFLELREGARPTTEELRLFCRAHLAGFKTPKYFVIGPLPKTSTGKIQKYELRDRAKNLGHNDSLPVS